MSKDSLLWSSEKVLANDHSLYKDNQRLVSVLDKCQYQLRRSAGCVNKGFF